MQLRGIGSVMEMSWSPSRLLKMRTNGWGVEAAGSSINYVRRQEKT